VTIFITMPFSGLLLVLTTELTTICLGEKWLEIVPVMQVLAVGGLLRALAATTGPVFYGLGIPAFDTFWQVVRLIILACAIYPLSMHWGLKGAAFAVLLSISVSTVGFLAMLVYRIKVGVLLLTKILLGPFISTVLLMIIVSSLKVAFNPDSLLVLFAITTAGTIGYLLTSIVYDRILKTTIINTVFNDFVSCTSRNSG
jgi:O-antigen/teichoic acid export membrane protein